METILVVLMEDHKRKLHDSPNKPNRFCPKCIDDAKSDYLEAGLLEAENYGNHSKY